MESRPVYDNNNKKNKEAYSLRYQNRSNALNIPDPPPGRYTSMDFNNLSGNFDPKIVRVSNSSQNHSHHLKHDTTINVRGNNRNPFVFPNSTLTNNNVVKNHIIGTNVMPSLTQLANAASVANSTTYESNYDNYKEEDNHKNNSEHDLQRIGSNLWKPHEDEIIFTARASRKKGWASEAKKALTGRSMNAIHSRWKRTLRFKDITIDPSTGSLNSISIGELGTNTGISRCKSKGKWTPEEDDVIIREHDRSFNRWVVNAAAHLPNRTRDAIRGRWRDMLKYKSIGAAQVTSKVEWTHEEDSLILGEYQKDPKTYIERCVMALSTRTVRSIRGRWNDVLKCRYYKNGTDTEQAQQE